MLSTIITDDLFFDLISNCDVVFHYTKKLIAIEDILPSRIFKLGQFRNSSDPSEYKIISYQENESFMQSENIPLYLEVTKTVELIVFELATYFAACNNEYENGSLVTLGCLKNRMWSQYGEGQRGICLAFSKKKLVEAFLATDQSQMYDCYSKDIEYKEDFGMFSGSLVSYIRDHGNDETIKDIAHGFIREITEELFFWKSMDYQSEQEYRMIILPKTEHFLELSQIIIKDCLLGLILGEQFHRVHQQTMVELASSLDIYCRKLVWQDNQWSWANWYTPDSH